MHRISKSAFKKLYSPPTDSKKGDNGVLLILGGSKKYHGAPIFSILAASHFVDLVYFQSIPENQRIIRQLKAQTPEFTNVMLKDSLRYFSKADAILIGPGLGEGKSLAGKVNNTIRTYGNKKFILDADALKAVDKRVLEKFGKNIILTPHKGEFKILFNLSPNKENVHKMCKKYGCIIVLKGKKDIVCSPKTCYYNSIGNPGLTKGGTGDVLAGLIAAFSCKNDLLLSAQAGTLLIGQAAQDLKKKYGLFFNAQEVAVQLPISLNHYLKK